MEPPLCTICGCQTAIIVPRGGSFLFYKNIFTNPQFNWGFCHAYSAYEKDITDKTFTGEHKAEPILYEKALANLKKLYSKIPNSKQIFKELKKTKRKTEYPYARVFFIKI